MSAAVDLTLLAASRISAVLDLHQPCVLPDCACAAKQQRTCVHCSHAYPCPTVRTLMPADPPTTSETAR